MVLERSAGTGSRSVWLARLGGVLSLVFGAAALIAGLWTQFGTAREITELADLRVVLPLGSLALVAGIVSLVRRERPVALAVGGMAMGLAAPVLGWVVLVSVVAAAALLVILVIAKFQ